MTLVVSELEDLSEDDQRKTYDVVNRGDAGVPVGSGRSEGLLDGHQ